jgi:competence protein ComEC
MLNIIKFANTVIDKEHSRLVLWLPVLFGLGVGIYFLLPFESNIWWLVAICCGLLLLVAIFWSKNSVLRLFFLAFLVVAAGALRVEIRTQSVAAPVLHKQLFFRQIEGKISDIQVSEKGEKIYLTNVAIEGVEPENTPKMASVSLKMVTAGLAVGDKIQLHATLFPPPAPAMPRSFDFARMFYYMQLGAVGYSPKPPILLEKGEVSSFDQWLNELRLSIKDRILAPMSEENGWIASAMMVGEQSGVSKDVADAMRESGIYHVLSISGLHMSLAVMIMYVSVRFLLSLYPPFSVHLPVKKIAALVGLISSFAYLLIAGYPVPAVRSFVMVACVMVAILVDRTGISIFSLAWAGLITLLWQPESMLGASFQLSFAATIAIVAFYERYSHLLHKPSAGILYKIWLYFFGIIVTSLLATIATTPLVTYHFNRFTVWGIIANMLMLPLASAWIMPWAVIAFLALPFGWEHYPLVMLDYGISQMMVGARFFASLPYAAIPLPSPSFWGLLLAVLGGFWLVIWREKWCLLGVPMVIIGMLTVFLHTPYDLLINDDASRVAMRLEESGKYLFLRGKDSSFDGQMWLRNDAQNNGVALDDMEENVGNCEQTKCSITAYHKKIVVTKGGKKELESSVCEGNPDIVISANYLDRNPACASVPLLIDKAYLKYNGATALRFMNEQTKIETAKQFRGNRPWVVLWH